MPTINDTYGQPQLPEKGKGSFTEREFHHGMVEYPVFKAAGSPKAGTPEFKALKAVIVAPKLNHIQHPAKTAAYRQSLPKF